MAASALLLAALGCDEPEVSTKPAAKPSAAAEASAAAKTSTSASASAKRPKRWRVPLPPRLAVIAGAGLSAIRFGATVKTIERQIGAPCDVKSETECRYISRAIDFHLKDGVLERIHVHRAERPAGKLRGRDVRYGIFNGAIPPQAQIGMFPSAVQEFIGKPKKVEKVDGKNPFDTVERHSYDGMILEYDELDNGNTVLGGIIVVPDPNKQGSAAAATPKKKK